MKVLSGKSCHLMVQILIVEGHTSIGEYLRSVLERLGHQVTVARDGAEGLELARLTPPAIVFIDILSHISFLNLAWEPSNSRRHLYSCGFERDEDAPEVHPQWVKHKTSHFSYRSTLL